MEDRQALILTLFGEARGEPIEGIVAVGCVIRNRVRARRLSYVNICLEPKAFSCWDVDDVNYPILRAIIDSGSPEPKMLAYYKQCEFVADGIMSGALLDNTLGSRNYLTRVKFYTDPPKWARNVVTYKTIGNQVFFSA